MMLNSTVSKTLFILLVSVLCSCNSKTKQNTSSSESKMSINMNDIYAWCIVPYDNQERTPEERINMLKSLGIKQYAYDWRMRHLPSMAKELQLAKTNNINVNAVWLWIDANYDQPGALSESNEKVLQTLRDSGLATQLWIGFHNNNFEGKSDTAKVRHAVKMVRYLNERAQESGSKVALYNHGGWSGEPENQVEIIKSIPNADIGIIYNLHHGHDHIDRFEQVVQIIKPHLWAVNLNGMMKDGPKILPVGKGDHEQSMLKMLRNAGFTGPFGILGHVEDADVKEVLKQNIEGLNQMLDIN